MQLMFEFENFMCSFNELRWAKDSWWWWWRRRDRNVEVEDMNEEWNIMFSKACQQYFKLSRRLEIQLKYGGNFKLTFHSWQINFPRPPSSPLPVAPNFQRLQNIHKFWTFHLILLNFNSLLLPKKFFVFSSASARKINFQLSLFTACVSFPCKGKVFKLSTFCLLLSFGKSLSSHTLPCIVSI